MSFHAPINTESTAWPSGWEMSVYGPHPEHRDHALDGLRTVAAVAVVLQHVMDGAATAGAGWTQPIWGASRFALPVFFGVAGLLHASRGSKAEEPDWLRRRVVRLVWPWFIWLPAFALRPVIALEVYGVTGQPGNPARYLLQNVIGGGGLWFFPVMIAVTSLAWLLRGTRARRVAMAVCLGAYLVLAPRLSSLSFLKDTYWPALPMFLFVYLAGYESLKLSRRWGPGFAVEAGVLLALAAAVAGTSHQVAVTLAALGGVGLVCGLRAGWLRHLMAYVGSVRWLRGISLGVYLAHPFILALVVHGLGDRVSEPAVAFAVWVVVAAMAVVAVNLMRRVRFLQRAM